MLVLDRRCSEQVKSEMSIVVLYCPQLANGQTDNSLFVLSCEILPCDRFYKYFTASAFVRRLLAALKFWIMTCPH